MKIAIFGRDKEAIRLHRKEVKEASFIYDEKNPDIVVSLGGDGTFLMSERLYPGIPKILVRGHNICVKCEAGPLSEILQNLKAGKYRIEEYRKLEAEWRGKKILAVNDIVIRNKRPIHAIRFLVFANDKQEGGEFIGDGVVISSPFGSTAYYYSITKRTFKKGLGIAFNNLAKKTDHMIVPENSAVEIKLSRGDATFSWDNNEEIVAMRTGESVRIKMSDKVARIIRMK
ncbi:MAG: NAD(+)/NADH kinase [Candidatus Aenigmarchaeota archaeon]|nr:NAD(+)/NADH kinase [Candidatus Aenigmarchaeota archaeon]